MIYSTSCQYALRALVYLAHQGRDRWTPVKEISEQEGLPKQFLGKLLGTLTRTGITATTRGPGGGHTLARDPYAITLLDVVRCIDGDLDLRCCVVGLMECSDAEPCALHDEWMAVSDSIRSYLVENTVGTLCGALKYARAPDACGA